jgi:uncharacterized protein (DUF111 family)
MPSMIVDQTGFGAGTADPPGRPNVVQAVVGIEDSAVGRTGRPCHLLETNVDDATAEVMAHTLDALIAVGAHDAWITPILMKKGRPAHTLSALCDDASFAAVRDTMVVESGTLGVRSSAVHRWPQRRDEHLVRLEGHEIRVKVGDHRIKVEYDDARIAALALGRPLREVLAQAEALASFDA